MRSAAAAAEHAPRGPGRRRRGHRPAPTAPPGPPAGRPDGGAWPGRRRAGTASVTRSLGPGRRGERQLHRAQHLLGGLRSPSADRAGSMEYRAVRSASPAAAAWWASSGRLSGGGSPPRAASRPRHRGSRDGRSRQRGRGRRSHLLVGEPVVGRGVLRVRGQEARRDRRLEHLGQGAASDPPRPAAARTERRSRTLKLRPRTAASARSAFEASSGAARPGAGSASGPPTGRGARRCAPATRRRRSAGSSRRRGTPGPALRR